MLLTEDALWTDEVWRRGLRPEPALSVSEWADRHRVLPPTSPEPGPWRTERTPYLREIMDCLSATSPVERVVLMAGSQLGKTEALLNSVGYCMAHAPGLMLLVMPSIDMIRRNTATRIDPMIEATPLLRDLVVPFRSKDGGNSIFRKRFPGGHLVMTGANSAAGLRSTPARYLFLDEVDAYPGDLDTEGDPVALAVQRTVNFARRKILMVSTPTIHLLSRIEQAFLESDRRRFWVPCPHCGALQTLKWAQMRWPANDPGAACYLCEAKECSISEHLKPAMLVGGHWKAEAPGDGRTAGFHLSGLYSPWRSWGEGATEFLACKGDPVRLKPWVNGYLAESWEEDAEGIDGDTLLGRREGTWPRLPEGVALLTAGVDIQDDRIEIEIVGWGRDRESWSIDYRVLWGDPSAPAVWADLDTLLQLPWPHARALPPLQIKAAAIDTGGHHTLAVYRFCRARLGRRVFAIKGVSRPGDPIWPRRPSRNNKGRVPLFAVNVDAAKEAILARLKIETPGAGYCHFPAERDVEYFRQLTAERAVTRYDRGRPKRIWFKRDADRNEALDARVYAMAALHGLFSMGLHLNREAARVAAAPLMEAVETTVSPRPVRRRPLVTAKSRFMGG